MLSDLVEQFWGWMLKKAILRVLADGARGATFLLDDPEGNSGLLRVRAERDWKQQ